MYARTIIIIITVLIIIIVVTIKIMIIVPMIIIIIILRHKIAHHTTRPLDHIDQNSITLTCSAYNDDVTTKWRRNGYE